MLQKYPEMCSVCNHPKLFNLNDHRNKVHGINGQQRKYWLSKPPYSTISSYAVRAHSSIPQSYSMPAQFGNSLPKTASLPEQKKLPNPVLCNSTSACKISNKSNRRLLRYYNFIFLLSCSIVSVTLYLSENEAENPQNDDAHLAQIPDFELEYLENHLAH